MAADGKIYLAGEDGLVFVLEAGMQFKLLATNPVGEPLMATPALSNGTLYLRGSRTCSPLASDTSFHPLMKMTRPLLFLPCASAVWLAWLVLAPRRSRLGRW